MPFIQLPACNTHYEQQGHGDTPIVFLHGNFGSWHYWQDFLQHLPQGYRAYAPDFRGCGDSEAPAAGYDIETLSEDILQFVNHLQLDTFHLVGHSLGGAVAQQLAGHIPERIISLTLVAPAPAGGLIRVQQLPAADSWFSAENIFQFLGQINIKRQIISASIKKSMPGLVKRHNYLNQAVDDALKMDPKAFSGFLATLKSWTGAELLKHFNFPVLIIYGDLDSVIPLQALKDMQQKISHCRLHIMRNIGHSPQLEQPREFNKLLSAFICGNEMELNTEQIIHAKRLGLLTKLQLIFKRLLHNNN
ncbi:alpha/beta hydrolase [Cycloclasticus sp. 46_83_sub15_T18]|nr:alpha/beta hydrolase [Cycloclasticus sp. 46_83_sub15_T18]